MSLITMSSSSISKPTVLTRSIFVIEVLVEVWFDSTIISFVVTSSLTINLVCGAVLKLEKDWLPNLHLSILILLGSFIPSVQMSKLLTIFILVIIVLGNFNTALEVPTYLSTKQTQ